MSKLECPSCEPIDCCVPSGLDDYLLVGPTFVNNQVSVLFDCPEGYVCDPGVYPLTITIPRGRIRWSPPVTPPSTPLRLQCCDGFVIRQVPGGISTVAYQILLQEMIDEAAGREAACEEKEFRTAREQSNDTQHVNCPNGDDLFNISGQPLSSFLPTSITISPDGKGLTIAPGVFRGTTKAAANSAALAFVTDKFNAAITAGKLQCGGTCTCPVDVDWVYTGEGNGIVTSVMTNIIAANNFPFANSGFYKAMLTVNPIACAPYSIDLVFAPSSCTVRGGDPLAYSSSEIKVDGVSVRFSEAFSAPGIGCQVNAYSFANLSIPVAGPVTIEIILTWSDSAGFGGALCGPNLMASWSTTCV